MSEREEPVEKKQPLDLDTTITVPCGDHSFPWSVTAHDVGEMRKRSWPLVIGVGPCPTCGGSQDLLSPVAGEKVAAARAAAPEDATSLSVTLVSEDVRASTAAQEAPPALPGLPEQQRRVPGGFEA